jgi:hypothetical protein
LLLAFVGIATVLLFFYLEYNWGVATLYGVAGVILSFVMKLFVRSLYPRKKVEGLPEEPKFSMRKESDLII